MSQPRPPYQPYPPQPGPPGGYYPPSAPKKTRKLPWIVGGVVAFLVIVGSCSGSKGTTTSSSAGAPVTAAPAATVAPTVEPSPAAAAAPPAAVEPPAAAPQPSGPMTSFDDVETLAVGEDIAPGQYTTTGAPGGFLQNNCYYEIHKTSAGTFSDLIKNGNIGEGAKGRVSLKAGQYFSSHGGCTWTKAG